VNEQKAKLKETGDVFLDDAEARLAAIKDLTRSGAPEDLWETTIEP
jgi:hypothetical protein